MATSLLVRGACPHDCPDTCGMITEVRDGQIVRISGDPGHPITQGWLCAKVRHYRDHVEHPGRLMFPKRRVGPKGSGLWERISWEAALATIHERWSAIIARHGAEAILPYSYSGTLGLVQMTVSSARFWNRLGASQLERSICGAAAEKAVEATLGRRWSAPYPHTRASRLVILWGCNPVATAPHFMPFLKDAQRQGARLVVIDPKRTASAQAADLVLQPLPGTDGILALGIAHLLVRANQHDEDWLARHALGWPELRDRLAEFPPERVARETGLDRAQLATLADWYGSIRPGLIKIADGINRNRNGGQNVRAILALPALTGQYGQRGGGLAYSTSGYVKWDPQAVHHLPPTTRVINMNRLGAALLGDVQGPPIQSLYVFGANPATSSPNTAAILRGLAREDLFTVVHELFQTDTADYADIVLPATSQLEQTDLHKGYGLTSLTYNAPAIPPRGECMSNWAVMGMLAERFGFREPWLHQEPDAVIEEVLTATARNAPWLRGITLERLRHEGTIPFELGDDPPFAEGRFPTASGKVELYSRALAAEGIEPLPGRFQPREDDGGLLAGDPGHDPAWALELITSAPHHFVSSTFASQEGLLASAGPPKVEIHSADAAARGIRDGQRVRVGNGRGAVTLRAELNDAVRPGVAVAAKGRWANLSGGRHVNWTTSDAVGDMAGQSTFHANRVWITPED